MRILLQTPNQSRRKTSRLHTQVDIRVYWTCAGYEDILRVRNICLGGLFLETREPRSVGTQAQIDFLVDEGQIRTQGVVRHVERAVGMGLEFTAIAQEDRPRLAALLARLRASSSPQTRPL